MLLSALLFFLQVANAPRLSQLSAALSPSAQSPEGVQPNSPSQPPQAVFPPTSKARPSATAAPAITQVAIGRNLAVQNCQSCHAIGRFGRSPNPAAPKFKTLSHNYAIDDLSEAFVEGVFIGHSVMPEFEFAPDKVEALMAYLKSVKDPVRRKRRK